MKQYTPKMKFIGDGETVLHNLRSQRICSITGKTGGGKTIFAIAAAAWLAENFGYRITSNAPCVWAEKPVELDWTKDKTLKTVVIFDEGGEYFQSGALVKMVASYQRKMDTILLFPSAWEPSMKAQAMRVQAVWNFRAVGLPWILYMWSVRRGEQKDKGWFIWTNSKDYQGLYSSNHPGYKAESFISWLAFCAETYRDFYEADADISEDFPNMDGDRIDKIRQMETDSTDFEAFEEGVARMEQVSDDLVSVFRRKRRRR